MATDHEQVIAEARLRLSGTMPGDWLRNDQRLLRDLLALVESTQQRVADTAKDLEAADEQIAALYGRLLRLREYAQQLRTDAREDRQLLDGADDDLVEVAYGRGRADGHEEAAQKVLSLLPEGEHEQPSTPPTGQAGPTHA